MGRLTTHVLDTTHGRPAGGVKIQLFQRDNNQQYILSAETHTDKDGRCESPLLEGKSFAEGLYRLDFFAADYFKHEKVELPDPPFLDVVSINFGIAKADDNYHVPLLISPYGFSTYRGS